MEGPAHYLEHTTTLGQMDDENITGKQPKTFLRQSIECSAMVQLIQSSCISLADDNKKDKMPQEEMKTGAVVSDDVYGLQSSGS